LKAGQQQIVGRVLSLRVAAKQHHPCWQGQQQPELQSWVLFHFKKRLYNIQSMSVTHLQDDLLPWVVLARQVRHSGAASILALTLRRQRGRLHPAGFRVYKSSSKGSNGFDRV